MSEFVIYHNPRCTKSRKTLELLEEKGLNPEVVLYMDEAPTGEELEELCEILGMSPRDLIRTEEREYRDLELEDANDDELLEVMSEHPKLIQRPIVVKDGRQAAIGRPPESVEVLF
jgi:arsenate reductase